MRKLDKFRRNPERFFADSKYRGLRCLGRILQPLTASTNIRYWIRNPQWALADSNLPVIGTLGRAHLERIRIRRKQLLSEHGYPLVSVVMAAFNAEQTIVDAILALQAQTYRHWELVVVDDRSSDQTAFLVEEMSGDPRIRLIKQPVNGGAASARNQGLTVATGQYMTFHDADDRSHPLRLELQVEALLANPTAVVCVCNSQREDNQGRSVEINGRWISKAIITMMFSRVEVLDRIGYLLELPVSEDAEYYERLRAAFINRSEVILHPVLYFQRFSPYSLLFADGDTQWLSGQSVSHQASSTASKQWTVIVDRIKRIRMGQQDVYVAPGVGL